MSAAPQIQVDGLAFATNGFAFPLPSLEPPARLLPARTFGSSPCQRSTIQNWTTNQVRLSWYTAFPGYTLQSEPGLVGTWAYAGLTVTAVGNEYAAYDTIGPDQNSTA